MNTSGVWPWYCTEEAPDKITEELDVDGDAFMDSWYAGMVVVRIS